MHGGIRPEQLRERSRTAFTHRASGTAPSIEHPSAGHLRRQAIQNAKPESVPKPADRPCLRFNSAKPCTRHSRQTSSFASVTGASSQHRPTCPRAPGSQAPDTPVVGQLNQEAQDALGPSAQLPAGASNELQAQDASASKQGGLQPNFFAPPPRWSQHLLGVSVPKPRPLTRPPPRSLAYKPPASHKPEPVKPLGLFTVKDLPSHKPPSTEPKPRTLTRTPAMQARPEGLISRASQETTRKEACTSAWHEILQALGSASSLYSSITNSKYPDALLRKSLDRFTAGTLERYIASTRQFLDFLGLSNRTIASLDVAFLADFLHACENSLEEDREVCKIGPRPILKALSWLSRTAEVPALQPILQASLIRAFLTQPTTDRKEALPLPLAVVVAWERYVCSPHCPQDLRLFLGGLLLALHGGLRFGDLQRIRLNSLSLTSTSLRGVCWQTKTTKRGQPFAVTLHGISGRALESLWVLPFLRAPQSAWIATEAALSLTVSPDFILPVLTNLGGLARPSSIYSQPMAYSQSLAAMRHFVTLPWQDSTKPIPVTPEESRAFTLHSLKVCLLAAGAQVRATEEARQHQGHHKSPASNFTAETTPSWH